MIDFSKEFEKYLNLYLDDRLEPDMADQFEKYLADNPEQALELAALRKIDAEAKSEAPPDLPEGYWDGLQARIDTQVRKIESEKLSFVLRIKRYLQDRLFHFVPAARIASITLAILTVALISRNFIGDFHVTDMVEEKPAVSTEKAIAAPLKQSAPPLADSNLLRVESDSDSFALGRDESTAEDFRETEINAMAIPKAIQMPSPAEDKITEKKGQVGRSIAEQTIVSESAPIAKQPETSMDALADLAANAQVAESLGLALSKDKEIFAEDMADSVFPKTKPQSVKTIQDEIKVEPQAVGDLKEQAMQGKGSVQEITPDQVKPIDSFELKKQSKSQVEIQSAETRPGEDEMDSTLYLKDEAAPVINADDLKLEEFPKLSWDAPEIEKKSDSFKSSVRPKKLPVPDESVALVSQADFLKNELDSVIYLYNGEYYSDRKINYFREIVERAFEYTKFESNEDNLRRLKKLLDQALSLGIIEQAKYEEYKKSLPLLDRIR